MKKYLVTLTAEERQYQEQLLAKGKAAARTLAHAHALGLAAKNVASTRRRGVRLGRTPIERDDGAASRA
jgi:hypothetical protein